MNEQTLAIDNELSPHSAKSIYKHTTTPEPGPLRQRPGVGALTLSTLLLRTANRVSFVLLGFYLGQQITSQALIAIVLEAAYISEFLLAPLAGSLSDRYGRKRFLLLAPLLGGAANLILLLTTLLFPHPAGITFGVPQTLLLLLIFPGRLLEGMTTALNTPVSLSYIADIPGISERFKARIMTLLTTVTMVGLAGGILLGGSISSLLGTRGYIVVIALHSMNMLLVACCIKEHMRQRSNKSPQQEARHTSLKLLKDTRILMMTPVWFAFNTLIGAWMTNLLIMLATPDQIAEAHHPGQLLYGGFSKKFATLVMSATGLLFLLGIGAWLLIIPRIRRTTTLLINLAGLCVCVLALALLNNMPDHANNTLGTLIPSALPLLPGIVLGVMALSGFIPLCMTQLSTISAQRKEQHGAIMGLYSIIVSLGQFVGAILGGLAIDLGGFYGLLIFTTLAGLLATISVIAIRLRGNDLVPA